MPRDREYDDTNTGTFGRNERKNSDRHPDVRGSLHIECPECREKFDMWLSAWKKERRSDGEPFYSVALQVKEDRQDDRGGGRRDDRQDTRRRDDDGLGGRSASRGRDDDRGGSRGRDDDRGRGYDRRDERREPARAGAASDRRPPPDDDEIPF